jgi:methylthioribose-1-phosphate isomerase
MLESSRIMRTIAVKWMGGQLAVLDQTKLPFREEYAELSLLPHYVRAIKTMVVRGAPLIGIVAAFGMAQEASHCSNLEPAAFRKRLARALDALSKTRPTAVNLFWALERQREVLNAYWAKPPLCARKMLAQAKAIHNEQLTGERKMAQASLALIPHGCAVLTICNSGPLATGGIGTALGTIIYAHKHRRVGEVFVPETRPRMQGRLTAWELERAGVPFTVIADGAVGALLASKHIGIALVGADRIAANGDTANKVGTYTMAVLCREHRVPFIVVAPESTRDLSCPDGSHIRVEERSTGEIAVIEGKRVMPKEWRMWNPAFDITPRALVTSYVTENGVQPGGRRK